MNPQRFLKFTALACAALLGTAHAAPPMLPWDGIRWEVHSKRAVIAGDIHGDFPALMQILYSQGIIDAAGDYLAGDFFQLGDLVDRGEHGRLAMDAILRLRAKAQQQGRMVDALLGNHELLLVQGDYRYITDEDAKKYADFATTTTAEDFFVHYRVLPFQSMGKTYPITRNKAAVLAAFRDQGPYAKWTANERNTISIVRTARKSLLLVHAGIGRWLLDHEPGEINATMRAWLRYYQGQGSRPPRGTDTVIEDAVWTENLQDADADGGLLPESLIDAVLAKYRVDHIVVGHRRTESNLIETLYNGKVIRADTSISSAYATNGGGRLTAVVIDDKAGLQIVNRINRHVGPSFIRKERARLDPCQGFVVSR